MANTGNKQATIAYKVSRPDGEPLDINGNLTRVSGKKQAIALLVGYVNPNPYLYEVELYFTKNDAITGNPTIIRDAVTCPFGYIRIRPGRIVLDPSVTSSTVTLESSNSWRLIGGPTNIATIDYMQGSAGVYDITIRRTGSIGQGYFTFQNTATGQKVSLFVVNVVDRPWILEDGTWNTLGFWYDDGTWKYGTN